MKTFTHLLTVIMLELSTSLTLGSTVSLLPIQQAEVDPSRHLDDAMVSCDLAQRLAALPAMGLIPFAEVTEIQENRIMEDAIFEILVTDELHRSLARLETWDSAIPWSRKLVQLAEHCPADFLVDVTIRPWNRQWRVTTILYDVQARRPVHTKSFTEVSHDPVTVSQEIAKHVTRSLWQVQHQRSRESQRGAG